jgi:hypothetical protein
VGEGDIRSEELVRYDVLPAYAAELLARASLFPLRGKRRGGFVEMQTFAT